MRVASLACVLAMAAVLGACGAGSGTVRPSKQAFIAQADGICGHLPTRLSDAGGGGGREFFVGAVHRFVDDSERSIARLRALRLPPDPDRRAAKRFVDAMSRVGVALTGLGAAVDRYVPADPTDVIAVGRSFRELDMVGSQVDRFSKAADRLAAGYGFRSCGHQRLPRQGGSPPILNQPPPPGLSAARGREFLTGQTVAAQSGCEACHRIGSDGNNGPGPDLTAVGVRLSPGAIARVLRDPTAPMPSFRNLPPGDLPALVAFLSAQRPR